jgi:preprotein translocase subunit YajC
MNNYLMLLEASTSASGKGSFQMIILMVLFFVGMYFLMIRPQKKQQKKEQEIRENTQVGDEITTIGGIVGKVVTVKEDSLIIETGADKNKMKITRWAIQTNVTANEKIKAEREAAKAAALKAKEEKAKEKADKKNKD